ncbi:hypothetical protein AX769_00470 [Frondihabitans sp. PAMC 28766]|uniref:FAD-binding protein n=1 Tax=Frondihabitans sp. PAMC 28766 TaxID=1795630 RepID=UPI00078C0297|nr:FAD-binding protein [Frondihabitans sp. PAMC 28766]AMM18889.1 hypothetical protein AX769_00470 [Frondihabitans sp. PAMC 28766]
MTSASISSLQDAGLPVFLPGTPVYDDATSPDNTSVVERPLAVVRPSTALEVAAAVRAAAVAGLVVAVQATGHGDGRPMGDETLLIDSRGLTSVSLDATSRTATVGAGTVWGDVQKQAFEHGLLGLSGTSATVGVSGYTFGGGIGWLTRPHGMASAALRAVTFVDGSGAVRVAADDASEADDREAIWAFRGGQPVGIATSLSFDLFEVRSLWAGYLLWPGDTAEAVVSAWAGALIDLPDDVTSTMSLLQLPPKGPFPPSLLGGVVVHLSLASPSGGDGAAGLIAAVRAAAAPTLDTTGPSNVERLVGIHLDPPAGNAARGTGAWLTGAAGSADEALRILRSARVGDDDGLLMIELRHLASSAAPTARAGAMTELPGLFLVHAVGGVPDAAARATTEAALAEVDVALSTVGVGRDAVSFRDGASSAGSAFGAADAARLRAIATRLDPSGVFRFGRPAGS